MGNGTRRAGARLHGARRALVAGVGLALLAPMLSTGPAQAGILDDLTDTVTDDTTSSIPIVGDVGDTVIDDTVIGGILEEGEQVVDGVVTDPSGTVTKIVDPESGVVTDAAGNLIGILDPSTGSLLLPPLPGIDSGAGQIEALVGGALTVLCTSGASVCDQVPLDRMVDEAAVILKAVPVNPGDIPAWDAGTCPEIVADICMISVDDLAGETPLAPIVSFLPGGSGNPNAPDTEITSPPPGKQSRAHTFTFKADPDTEETTFECKLEVAYKSTPPAGAQRSHDWQACGADPSGSHPYRNLANGTYVFAVQALEGDAADDTPATESWTVSVPPAVPETRIVSGPKGNAWVFANRVTYKFRSTVEGSDFQCWYDDLTNACDSGVFTWAPSQLTKGTHVFKVAALANKTQDFSPAVRTFHVPLDDRALRPVKSWNRKKQRGHFKNTYTVTTVKGATLVTRQKERFRRIALVADKGRGFGTVKVFWGKKMLKEVDLHAKRPLLKRRVIAIKRFNGRLRTGKIRVVVTSAGRPVRIDGIGLAKR